MMTKQQLILIRGMPGSGKSTLAKTMTGFEHLEADMFFIDENGEYTYNPEKIKEAHEWCQLQTNDLLEQGKSVVVANTFIRLWELKPYREIAKDHGIEPLIIHATGKFGNTHGVPDDIVESMRSRFEIDF